MNVSCVWLMPFYPSANKDDGYDITDFYGVDPALGTLGDFTELIRTCHDRGLRVIVDFVMNHTSDQHPWFRSARADRDSPYRDFYLWRDERPPENPADLVFPDKEKSNWAYDRKAGQYYFHTFYSHQPDLNPNNPEVHNQLAQVMAFWLAQGLSGFRVDAVPFLIEGAAGDPHQILRDLRAFLSRRDGPARPLGAGKPAPAPGGGVLGGLSGGGGPAGRGGGGGPPGRGRGRGVPGGTRRATNSTCCSPPRATGGFSWLGGAGGGGRGGARGGRPRRSRTARRWGASC